MYTGRSKCLKCGHIFEEENIFEGCPYCRTDRFVSNITPLYDLPVHVSNGSREKFRELFPKDDLETYRELLPFKEKLPFVDLGVGNTPVTKLPRLGEELGLDLYIKDETRNPTWGHKDRLNAVLVNKAIELHAPGVVYASTGNNGASGAALAAKAGLPCIILTVKGVNPTLEKFMQIYGACVIGAKSTEARWNAEKSLVDNYGWYPATNYVVPIVGSNPWAIDGYKLIAYELYKQMDPLPERIVVPICYGDALFGIMKGFTELREMGFIDRIPQMVSVEDYGPVAKAYNEGADIIEPVEGWGSVASSMSTLWGTYHSLYALRQSNGLAVSLDDNGQIQSAQRELASKEGVYCESASASTLAGLRKLLAQGKIKKGEKVVLLITASGVKDTKVVSSYLEEVPECEDDMASVRKTLEDVYGLHLR
ncbi:MAG: pyridoxal-phosphate dependent enzyme [Synergistes sp.]|nr:pyridoxal-phosphate dependent enzyme [Synergistes sp.]